MSELGKTLVEDVRKRMVEAYPAQVRAALETLSDEQLWWRPNPGANSVGNLVLHLVGSTRHFLGKGVAGSDYVRDRPSEFSDSGSRSREELEGLLTETAEETRRILDALDPEGLLEVSERTGEPHTTLALLLRVAHHWSVHSGQILYAAKALREGVLDEVWVRTMK